MSSEPPAISHITLGTNDPRRAARFYDATLRILGFTCAAKVPDQPLMYCKGDQMPRIFVYYPFDDKPATAGNGSHVAFLAETRTAVDDFYKAALANGGEDEGAPGIREEYMPNYYAAYVRDPDGNKLQAVCYSDS